MIALLGSLVWTSVVLNGGQSAVISGNTNSGLDTHGADDRLTRHGSRSESQFTHRKSNNHHNLSQHKSMKLKVKRNSNYQEIKDLDRVNNFFYDFTEVYTNPLKFKLSESDKGQENAEEIFRV